MKPQAWPALALFLVFAGSSAPAAWQIEDSQRESSPDELVEHRTTTVANPETDTRATLHFAIFESRTVGLRVIDQRERPWRDLSAVMAQTNAIAGVNGGYFDPHDAPVGLLVSDGQVRSRLSKARLLSGVLFASGREVNIVRARSFTMTDKIQSAVQCGPVLVERGAPVAGLDDARRARRTFAAVNGKGRAALGVCSAVSLAQLGRILCLTNAAGKLEIGRALNLDGGSSSAFWFAGRDGVVSMPEQKTVRDFVTLVPQSTR
jgi:uncharacterized protein YigE (DUF2233 family)